MKQKGVGYRLHGFDLVSPLPLKAERVEPSVNVISMRVDEGHALADPVGRATILSRYVFPNGAEYTHVRDDEGFLSTYFDRAQFRLTADRTRLTVRVAPGVAPDWAAVLLAGSYPAFLVFLSGRAPLHASAVWLPALRGAVAFLATPGGGKSTLAGALCLAGGRLISDDLLSLDAALRCEPGSRALRLRNSSREFIERFGARACETSVDERFVVDAREPLPAELPLKVLLQPVLDRGANRSHLERLTGGAAFQALACDPRVKGLIEPAWVRAAFAHSARLVREIPVYRLTVPYRDRNFTEVGRQVLTVLA